ncbi:MAG: hypothetical protein ACRD1H_05770 [Vicinamibacterales bacterium]
MTGAVVVAVLAWAVTTGVLLLLPPGCALATMFGGLIAFSVGAKLHWRWPVAVGGVLMFAGVFAAALLDALG